MKTSRDTGLTGNRTVGFRNAAITLNSHSVQLTFDQQKQTCLDALRFKDRSTIKEIPHGKGRIFWTAYSNSRGDVTRCDLYACVAGRLGVTPGFEFQSPVARGVLVYPIELRGSVLHVMVSDSSEDVKVDLRDTLTGARLTIRSPANMPPSAWWGNRRKKWSPDTVFRKILRRRRTRGPHLPSGNRQCEHTEIRDSARET